jgi:hypothetical protein
MRTVRSPDLDLERSTPIFAFGIGVRTRSKHKRFASALVKSSAYPASRTQAWRILEALWKQEGRNGRGFSGNGAKVAESGNLDKGRKCRGHSKTSESNRSRLPSTHNLKVVGSNPTPATKFSKQDQSLTQTPRTRVRDVCMSTPQYVRKFIAAPLLWGRPAKHCERPCARHRGRATWARVPS